MKTFLLIDTHALVHRFFHALPPLTTPRGEPIGAIYGLCGVLLKLLTEGNGDAPPDYLAAALDRPEPTFRKQEFSDYKVHRPPAPDALISQLKKLPDCFAAFGIPTFSIPGFEADDIIGSLVEKFSKTPELKIVILTGDLDALQLVSGDTVVANIIKTGISATVLYDEAAVVARYGLLPSQLPDYKSLVGDASDNIPGVPGIGPKAAAALLLEFNSVEGIYDNIALVPRKHAEALAKFQSQAVTAKRLATIERHAPLPDVSLESMKVSSLRADPLAAYFATLGFSSFVKRLKV